jgi:uncharacterized repeat protein (TIGR01451 family)
VTIFNSWRALFTLVLVISTGLLVGAASLAPRINVSLSGTVSREGRQIPLEEAGRVTPREVISWNIIAANTGNADASSINVVGDIDDGTSFVPGSAQGDGVVSVKYSLEHPHENQTFSVRPMVRVTQNGVVRERPATSSEYKAVQLTFAKIGAGETLKASYRTRVR